MITVPCPAKINLYLRVLGKLPEGYHRLETLFQEIDLCDQLSWSDQPELVLEVEGASLGPMANNLVWRAIQGFAAASGCAPRGRFHLLKRIPAGGGLGGGSSDAAAALRLMQQLHGAPLKPESLAALALALGSDVPFFLNGGCQLGQGRGELLEPTRFEVPVRRGFLFLPDLALSTADVFRAYADGRRALCPAESRLGENDLLVAALSVSTAFAAFWGSLNALLAGETLFMTGSGSTCVWLTERVELPPELTDFCKRQVARALPFRFADSP